MQDPARFASVNPQLSLAALHDRMIVFDQDERGKLDPYWRRAARQGAIGYARD